MYINSLATEKKIAANVMYVFHLKKQMTIASRYGSKNSVFRKEKFIELFHINNTFSLNSS